MLQLQPLFIIVAIATVTKMAAQDKKKRHRWRLCQLFLLQLQLQQVEEKKVHKKFGQDLNQGTLERKATTFPLC